MFHFALYKYLKTSDSNAIIKLAETFLYQGGCPMYNLFSFAIGVRLVAFMIFVACVYGGNVLYTRLEHRKTKFLWKIGFVTLYSFFLLLVTYVVWFVFYFGLNT